MFGRILYRLLFILLILTITSCGIHQSPKCAKYYYLGTARTNTTLTIKIDKHFDLAQQIQIQKAFDTWTKMSDYKLIFNLEFNKPRPALYKEWSAPTKSAGLFFWNLEKTQTQMTPDQIEQWKTYWGLMVYGDGEDSGNIIVFQNTTEDNFYSVALHEIGHLIGIGHIHTTSVMHPSAIVNCITPLDAIELCKLYHCIPKPECDQEGRIFGNNLKIE